MGWISNGSDRRSTLGVLPEISLAFDVLYQSLWKQQHVPPAVLELCRLRLAQLHRCDVELHRQECPVPDTKRDKLSQWSSLPLFTDEECA
jgi:hypothetical protein